MMYNIRLNFFRIVFAAFALAMNESNEASANPKYAMLKDCALELAELGASTPDNFKAAYVGFAINPESESDWLLGQLGNRGMIVISGNSPTINPVSEEFRDLASWWEKLSASNKGNENLMNGLNASLPDLETGKAKPLSAALRIALIRYFDRASMVPVPMHEGVFSGQQAPGETYRDWFIRELYLRNFGDFGGDGIFIVNHDKLTKAIPKIRDSYSNTYRAIPDFFEGSSSDLPQDLEQILSDYFSHYRFFSGVDLDPFDIGFNPFDIDGDEDKGDNP